MKTAYLEWHGCPISRSESGQAAALLRENGFEIVGAPEDAEFMIINTCGVKETTEQRMLSRIKELSLSCDKRGAKLIAFGCLPKMCPEKIRAISRNIIVMEGKLELLSEYLGIGVKKFSLKLAGRENGPIAVIPIANGCLGNCTYCSVKLARGKLASIPEKEITARIAELLPGKKEFWLTAQDTGCYGFDTGTSLPKLLKRILKTKGNYRIRIGMMNPNHAKKIIGELLPLFEDKRLYRFLHIPVQSGSSEILKKMKRGYTAKDFKELVFTIREKYPDFSIATDAITGFPGETQNDFEETISLIMETKPSLVNVSRFGPREGTIAAKMKQIDTSIRKERSRILSRIARKISEEENQKLVGTVQEVLACEKTGKKCFGRTNNYKPVLVPKKFFGKHLKARITSAGIAFLECKVTSN